MTTDRKIKANRANAQASTGPQTAQGRGRAARNALRHGLSLPVCSKKEVEMLAREISGPRANMQIQELARQVAEAEIDLRRVRNARHQLLSRTLAVQKNAPDLPEATVQGVVNSTPQGPYKFATILSQETKQLLAMDRYERRALSRRKFAVRALDDARHRSFVADLAERTQNNQPFQRHSLTRPEDIKTADIEDRSVIGIWNGQIHQFESRLAA